MVVVQNAHLVYYLSNNVAPGRTRLLGGFYLRVSAADYNLPLKLGRSFCSAGAAALPLRSSIYVRNGRMQYEIAAERVDVQAYRGSRLRI